ncbi:MAG: ferritin family protein [Candidatus Omnitrophota bacterium]
MSDDNVHFAGSEIVELGIQVEVNGKEFYDGIAEKSKNPDAKKVFSSLAMEEEKHVEDFKKILDPVSKYEPVESYPEEYFSYINAVAREHIFTKKDKGREIAKAVSTDKQAIEMAIGFEKDSILFYEGVKRIVPEHDKKLLDKLIEQEKIHLQKLWDLRKSKGGF